MVKDTIQHSCGKHRIAHHLSPLGDLLVSSKDDRGRFIRIAYESEEAISLSPADRCIADLIQNDQLRFAYVLKSEAGASLDVRIVEDLDEVSHPLKADCIAGVYGFKSEPHSEHRLA